jgi:hypothetical protein
MEEEKRWFNRKTEGGYVRRIVTRDILLSVAASIPDELHNFGLGMRSYGISIEILRGFFGLEWAEKHIMDDTEPRGFLNSFDTDEARETSIRRIINLAEMLVNFQQIKGVEACFDQIEFGHIESGFAELEAGKVLVCAGVDFQYIWQAKKKGKDFDIGLKFRSGAIGCADVKSKLGVTPISDGTIIRSLRDAQSQLPSDYPGVVFLKLPGKWWDDQDAMKAIAGAVNSFIRGTTVIVSVVIIFSVDIFKDGRTLTWLHQLEILSDNHKFDRAADWRVLKDAIQIPPNWINLTEIVREATENKKTKTSRRML